VARSELLMGSHECLHPMITWILSVTYAVLGFEPRQPTHQLSRASCGRPTPHVPRSTARHRDPAGWQIESPDHSFGAASKRGLSLQSKIMPSTPPTYTVGMTRPGSPAPRFMTRGRRMTRTPTSRTPCVTPTPCGNSSTSWTPHRNRSRFWPLRRSTPSWKSRTSSPKPPRWQP
jgi:hypothetical protein